jgi:hypothetical protein
MSLDARVTARNAGLRLLQRGVQTAGGLLLAMTVPRLMGPAVYGRYALLTSLSLWFALLCSAASGPCLIERWGSLGACLAVLAASAMHAACVGWRLPDLTGASLRGWTGVAPPAALLLPLLWLRASWLVDAAVAGVFTVASGVWLVRSGLVRPSELSAVVILAERPRPARAPWGAPLP